MTDYSLRELAMVHGSRELVNYSHAKELTIYCLTNLYHWTMRVTPRDLFELSRGHGVGDLLHDRATLTCQ